MLGFIGMIVFRNIGDEFFLPVDENESEIWLSTIVLIKDSAKVFLCMAMAAVGLSTNLRELKSMGYRPFVVGFVASLTVGLVSILSIHIFDKLYFIYTKNYLIYYLN